MNIKKPGKPGFFMSSNTLVYSRRSIVSLRAAPDISIEPTIMKPNINKGIRILIPMLSTIIQSPGLFLLNDITLCALTEYSELVF